MGLKLGRKISEGACAVIYEWENSEKIIKLAKPNTDYHAMRREYLNSETAWGNGLSVPKPFKLVDVDGNWGIVFERIYGETLMERFLKQLQSAPGARGNMEESNYEDTTRVAARTLSEIHNKTIQNMPSQRERITNSINRTNYLTTSEKESVIRILNNLPIKQQLCHGDPNPNNILVRDDKAILIDWMDASTGNPEADLAEYIIMTRYSLLPADIPAEMASLINSIREEIISVFIEEYTKVSGITYEEIDAWILPVAARKLSADGITEDEKKILVNEIRRRLKKENFEAEMNL